MDDTDIFEYFLSLWDETFPSNNGKNDNDEYPIHAICRIKNVSLSVIKHLLAMDCRQALYALEKHNGPFPFHIASKADVSIDVIYTLFQHCADAFVQTLPTHNRHKPIIMAHQEPQSQQDQEPQTATAASDDEDDNSKNNDKNAASLSSTVVAGRARKRARC